MLTDVRDTGKLIFATVPAPLVFLARAYGVRLPWDASRYSFDRANWTAFVAALATVKCAA